MKIAVRILLVVAIVCETFPASEGEFDNLQIEKPDDCHISTSASFDVQHSMTCPGFTMKMTTANMTKKRREPNLQLGEELKSIVECSDLSPPYKYLRETNSKRNSLVLKKCAPPDSGSFGEGWPNLESFKFENYRYTQPLTRQHFSGLKNIRKLVLFINSTHQLEDDVLSDLTNLTELHMAVRDANKNMFRNLIKLEWLHLTIYSHESLSNFDMSEMKHLLALKTLELTGCAFTLLTKRFFEGTANVETLILKYNTIDAIHGTAFEPLTNLKHVSMLWNDLSSLPERLFSKNTKLETFYFRTLFDSGSISITSLPSGFFSNLPNLREITIRSELNAIPANLIWGSINLELLDLRFNRLTEVPRDLLQNHSKLKKIELYGNWFEDRTSTDLFDNKSPLTEVNVRH